jgi:toxin ParE1/3/4
MRLEFSAFVEGDLEEIADYIAADNPRRAVTFLQEIRAELVRVGHAPQLYQLRQDIGEDARFARVAST